MITVNCQVCGEEMLAQLPTKKFCKKCMTKRNRAIPRDQEKARIANKKWFDAHPGYRVEANRRYAEKHPEQYRKTLHESSKRGRKKRTLAEIEADKAYMANYYQANRTALVESNKRWIDAHPEQARASRIQRNHNRRAKEAQAEGKWTFNEFMELCEASDGHCYYCHKKCDKLTAEHMNPIARGGSNWIENIVPVCGSCNSSKKDRTLMEYFFPSWR